METTMGTGAAGTAGTPHKRFARQGKALMPGQFTCPEQIKSDGAPAEGAAFRGAVEKITVLAAKRMEMRVG